MADDKLFTTPPNQQRKPKNIPEPTGYIVKKDTTIAGITGFINVRAHEPIRDLFIIHRLKAANIELEPIYD